MNSIVNTPVPRTWAIALLLLVGTTFAANHIAARIAFDSGVGLFVAILMRSGVTALALFGLLLWRRQPLRVARRDRPWLVLLGMLISLQSVLLYSAVARIPVALALLVFNMFPVIFILLSWALGGPRPTPRAAMLMGVIVAGLVLVLDVPARLMALGDSRALAAGAGLASLAAIFFALSLWVTENRLHSVNGPLRSMSVLAVVFAMMVVGGSTGIASGAIPGAMAWPHDWRGWTGLVLLTVFYGSAFSVLFVFMPRLDMVRNAPALNMEPVATLVLGWVILDQKLSSIQIVGGVTTVAAIMLLSRSRA